MIDRDEAELEWWRREFSTRIEPGSVQWTIPGRPLCGHRLRIEPLTPKRDA